MKFLILLQVLLVTIEICKGDDEPNTTIILHDTRTEMTVEQQAPNATRSKANEFFDNFRDSESETDGNDLDFDYDDGNEAILTTNPDTKEQEMQEVLLKAMKKPAIRKQIGEVIPILRVMSPTQRLALAALVSSQIISQNTLSEANLTNIASMFAGKDVVNSNDHHNITEHLLLPISIDIAKMFKGLGREVGRNLRQSFHEPRESILSESKLRRTLRKPTYRSPVAANRRMDDGDYYELEEEKSSRPMAEALKQPGRDECDYFTKSLCLEVSNYPAEAIILSLKNNKEIAKTFLADFGPPPYEDGTSGGGKKKQSNVRRLERRRDGKGKSEDKGAETGYMCPSSLKYARPKRARATSGQWKYVVNAGEYTQTLRLEICQKPKSPCSYVTNHLASECTQVYNYHRLLTWDEGKGLHMDIFKVPSCCSCHIQGYSNFYPPNNDFTYADKRREPLELPETVHPPDLQERPTYNSAGFKREVPKSPPSMNAPPGPVKSQQHYQVQEFFPDPVDHLVPPGPPLPLENEEQFHLHLDSKFFSPQDPMEQNRRFPVEVDSSRIIPKPEQRTEFNDPTERVTSKQHFPPPLAAPPRPNFIVPETRGPSTVHRTPEDKNAVFDQGGPIRYLGPLITPMPIPQEIRRGNDGLQSPNVKKDFAIQSRPKVTSKPVQYLSPEPTDDAKSLPSRNRPFYVTPPKVKEVDIRSTTPSPPRKDESRKRETKYSPPQYLPLSSQEWIPVVGH